jgi:hypothetical protein
LLEKLINNENFDVNKEFQEGKLYMNLLHWAVKEEDLVKNMD